MKLYEKLYYIFGNKTFFWEIKYLIKLFILLIKLPLKKYVLKTALSKNTFLKLLSQRKHF